MSKVCSPAELRQLLLPIFIQYDIKRAVLFGSYAKGTADEKSDVDLLVDSGLRGLQFVLLCEDIRKTLDKEIDLLDVSHIEKHSKIDNEIESSGVVIHEK